jgi:hypothetical protein
LKAGGNELEEKVARYLESIFEDGFIGGVE